MSDIAAVKEIAIVSLSLIAIGLFWLWLLANIVVWLIARYGHRRQPK